MGTERRPLPGHHAWSLLRESRCSHHHAGSQSTCVGPRAGRPSPLVRLIPTAAAGCGGLRGTRPTGDSPPRSASAPGLHAPPSSLTTSLGWSPPAGAPPATTQSQTESTENAPEPPRRVNVWEPGACLCPHSARPRNGREEDGA